MHFGPPPFAFGLCGVLVACHSETENVPLTQPEDLLLGQVLRREVALDGLVR